MPRVCGSGGREWTVRKKAAAQTSGSQPTDCSHGQGEGLQLPPWGPLQESLRSMSHPQGIMADQSHPQELLKGRRGLLLRCFPQLRAQGLPRPGVPPRVGDQASGHLLSTASAAVTQSPLQAREAPSGLLQRPQHQTGQLWLEMHDPLPTQHRPPLRATPGTQSQDVQKNLLLLWAACCGAARALSLAPTRSRPRSFIRPHGAPRAPGPLARETDRIAAAVQGSACLPEKCG